jgi:hypothetical protein
MFVIMTWIRVKEIKRWMSLRRKHTIVIMWFPCTFSHRVLVTSNVDEQNLPPSAPSKMWGPSVAIMVDITSPGPCNSYPVPLRQWQHGYVYHSFVVVGVWLFGLCYCISLISMDCFWSGVPVARLSYIDSSARRKRMHGYLSLLFCIRWNLSTLTKCVTVIHHEVDHRPRSLS